MSGEVEKPEDLGTKDADVCKRWRRELELAGTHEKDWRTRAKKIVEIYRNEKKAGRETTDQAPNSFNILYSNTEVLKGVMYQKTPVPDVRRRFIDKDPVARQAAQILQRAISYSIDAYDFDAVMRADVEDILLPGRAVAKVRYVPTMSQDQSTVAYQEVTCDYVEWDLFRMSPAKRWAKVRWVAFGELMTRDDLVKAFNEAGKECELHWTPDDHKESEGDGDLFKRALVWQVWDKTSRKVIHVSDGLKNKPLSTIDDPLNLEGFFPCGEPVYSIANTSTMVPVPEYVQYQDQAMELDLITERIEKLVAGLKRRGIYDSTYKEIAELSKAGDDEFVAIENFANLAAKGGIEAALYEMPIETIGKVLIGLYQQRDQIKATIYEITGISDIARGATDPNETLGAQQLKAKYTNVRIQPRQQVVEKFARQLFRMKAEIISEKFTPEILKLITGPDMWMIQGQDATEPIMKILRNEKLRGFRVDVETGSTVEPDAAEEQKNRVELLTGITQFITGIGPAVLQGQIPMEFAVQLMSWGLRAFKVGPQLEEIIDSLSQQQGPQQQVMQLQQELGQYKQREDELKQREGEVQGVDMEMKKHEDDVRLRQSKQDDERALAERKMDMEQEVNMEKNAAQPKKPGVKVKPSPMGQLAEALQALAQAQAQQLEQQQQMAQQSAQSAQAVMDAVQQLAKQVATPKKLVRMQDGSKVAVPVTLN